MARNPKSPLHSLKIKWVVGSKTPWAILYNELTLYQKFKSPSSAPSGKMVGVRNLTEHETRRQKAENNIPKFIKKGGQKGLKTLIQKLNIFFKSTQTYKISTGNKILTNLAF